MMKWFELGLVVLTFATGITWLLDRLFFAKRRAQRAGLLEEKEPILVDYARAFFPVLFVVLILRSFIAEPFRIPSSSMMPTLLIGDFILVNKFTYGIRLPVSRVSTTRIVSNQTIHTPLISPSPIRRGVGVRVRRSPDG